MFDSIQIIFQVDKFVRLIFEQHRIDGFVSSIFSAGNYQQEPDPIHITHINVGQAI